VKLEDYITVIKAMKWGSLMTMISICRALISWLEKEAANSPMRWRR